MLAFTTHETFDQLEAIKTSVVSLSFYEYYDELQIEYTLSDGTSYTRSAEEECFLADDSCRSKLGQWLADHLPEMTNLVKFSYTSRFFSEMSYDFLVSKPESLKQVTICHCDNLDMKFLIGIESLTLENVLLEEENDGSLAMLQGLPSSIKHVVVGALGDIRLPLFHFTLESYD